MVAKVSRTLSGDRMVHKKMSGMQSAVTVHCLVRYVIQKTGIVFVRQTLKVKNVRDACPTRGGMMSCMDARFAEGILFLA